MPLLFIAPARPGTRTWPPSLTGKVPGYGVRDTGQQHATVNLHMQEPWASADGQCARPSIESLKLPLLSFPLPSRPVCLAVQNYRVQPVIPPAAHVVRIRATLRAPLSSSRCGWESGLTSHCIATWTYDNLIFSPQDLFIHTVLPISYVQCNTENGVRRSQYVVTWDVVSSDQAWLDLQTWHLATSEFQNQQRYATQMARVQERLDMSLPPLPHHPQPTAAPPPKTPKRTQRTLNITWPFPRSPD